MGNFAEVLAENQSKNVYRICIYWYENKVYNQVHNGFNENHPAYETNSSSDVATISVNPNTRSTGTDTISINPARHTSKANASEGEEDIVEKRQ